jgi:gamma-glutamyltranspeptidase/glutathione hydrolase
MLQVFLNINVFGMPVQDAIDAPRFSTYSYPGSFEPHPYYPARLHIESRIERAVGDALAARGHKVHWWGDYTWVAGAVCAIVNDRDNGVLHGGADPRRPAYVLGW